jgi:hypothetical protein
MKKHSTSKIVGSIHLYGTQSCGHGFIAVKRGNKGDKDVMFGDGEPVAQRSATSALWLAAEQLKLAGLDRGQVEVHVDTNAGSMHAIADLTRLPNFGSLHWVLS